MRFKLIGVNSGKVYYEAKYKSEVMRWEQAAFPYTSVATKKVIPEPMSVYDSNKHYRQTNFNFKKFRSKPIKHTGTLVLAIRQKLGQGIERVIYSSKREAAKSLGVKPDELLKLEGQEINGWKVMPVGKPA